MTARTQEAWRREDMVVAAVVVEEVVVDSTIVTAATGYVCDWVLQAADFVCVCV